MVMRMMLNADEMYPVYSIITVEGYKEKNADAIFEVSDEEYKDLVLEGQIAWDMFNAHQLRLREYYKKHPILEPYDQK